MLRRDCRTNNNQNGNRVLKLGASKTEEINLRTRGCKTKELQSSRRGDLFCYGIAVLMKSTERRDFFRLRAHTSTSTSTSTYKHK